MRMLERAAPREPEKAWPRASRRGEDAEVEVEERWLLGSRMRW